MDKSITNTEILESCIKLGYKKPSKSIYDLQEWLRNSYQIYIEVLIDKTCEPKYCYKLSRFFGNPNDLTEKEWYWELDLEYKTHPYGWCLQSSYEQALIEGIFESIKVIENDKVL